ncbi:substrate-binding domain-containing protein [Cohnella abietis]|uniref:LacI family transcriptional regulator n=1 Tax=Cohnella abietis TaxID=2507935 RepID=A0A3T1D1L3_9BACL|nr:substrate-binding domain-containing protein [Cohnella abietis]BBI31941.1 LacI family transcriptional regulator [Cohnella abietis]
MSIRKKKVTMQDIADRLGISKNSVSLAIMDKKGISDELREKVNQVAKSMGYKFAAKADESQKNVLILVPFRAMIYQDNDQFQYYYDLVWGIEKSARDQGFNAIIAKIDEEMERNLELPSLIYEVQFSSIILFGIVEKNYVRTVFNLGKPLVMLDSYYMDIPCSSVTSENTGGAYKATKLLIDAGHTEIGFIGPVNLASSHAERWLGYWKAHQDCGIKLNMDYCLTESEDYNCNLEGISSFYDHLKQKPTAFFCGNDSIASNLMDVLHTRGVAMPEEVSIVGFDDIKIATFTTPQLTTIKVDKMAMCEATIDLVQIVMKKPDTFIKWQIPTHLIERDSVLSL